MKYREAAVTGKFYPGTPNELKRQMTLYLGHGSASVHREYNQPKALIVPHAGYFYSGEVAAKAYQCLAPFRSVITHVVLLGPSHHVALQGSAVS
ncbi:AmmeMemoRadiSam system protein B [Vibrio sp. CDRSL-10 TSBA]